MALHLPIPLHLPVRFCRCAMLSLGQSLACISCQSVSQGEYSGGQFSGQAMSGWQRHLRFLIRQAATFSSSSSSRLEDSAADHLPQPLQGLFFTTFNNWEFRVRGTYLLKNRFHLH